MKISIHKRFAVWAYSLLFACCLEVVAADEGLERLLRVQVFNKEFEMYVGVENIGNFKQSPVIVDAENPYGPYFDSGLIWGPIFGREWYVGFRYLINDKAE